MPRTCTICSHAERETIDAALLAGAPLRNIAEQYALSVTALHRHKGSHIAAALAHAQQAAEAAGADTLLDQVRDLQSKTLALLRKAEKAGDLRTAVSAIGQARGNIELLGKLAGELQAQPTINLILAPEWVTVRTVLVTALLPYPEARAAVALELARLEDGHSS